MTEGTEKTREEIHVWEIEEFRSVVLEGDILYDVDESAGVATITFNRPERLNAITIAGFDYVSTLVQKAERDELVKVIVLKGAGPCFGTGGDANELGHYIGYRKENGRSIRPSQRRRMIPDRDTLFGARGMEQAIGRCLKPTIVAVHSYCYGGHLQIAAAADIVLATPDALFVHPAWRYLGPIFNFSNLIEKMGVTKTREMVLTARPLPADEAETAGLVTRVVPEGELDQWVDDYCTAIAALPTDGVSMGKAIIELVLDARGAAVGSAGGWIGHSWITNLKYQAGEWNFLKSRQEKGLTAALEERDNMVPKFFRMGLHRDTIRSTKKK
ncbi:MAG: enoyl-CoA hydratase/isomerase family protein [Ilumatobacteraceae bacterium]|nr:enoyl-CoA hydratase/isomerase family protein [Ilumatobacteraceae bacterium]